MRLNETQLKQTLNQINAEVLPDNHPAAAQLADLFGDHTFFLDQSGLKVLEPAETSASDVQTSQVISLADWSDANWLGAVGRPALLWSTPCCITVTLR